MALTPQGTWSTIRRAHLIRVLVVYFGASFAVTEAVDIFTQQGGLPDWVTPAAIVLLLLGLPIIVATALVQSAPSPSAESAPAAVGTTPIEEFARAEVGATPEPAANAADVAAVAKQWLTWRKAILGGVLAFALLGVATTGYMVMRVLGIGPGARWSPPASSIPASASCWPISTTTRATRCSRSSLPRPSESICRSRDSSTSFSPGK